jgi:acetyl esterase/lipase
VSFKKQTFIYKKVQDCEIKADLFKAQNDDRLHPLIIFIHGGALIYGSREWIETFELDLYLKIGFDVLSIDYRLAPETKLPEIIKDVQDAFKWSRENAGILGINKEKLAIIGHSGGGYLALMCGFCLNPRPKAIVSFYGYGDITGEWYSKPDPFYCQQPEVPEEDPGRNTGRQIISERSEEDEKEKFYLFLRQNGLWPLEVGGHDPVKERDFFIPYCPLFNIDQEYPPVLMLHGDSDTDVPYGQSVLMHEKLKNFNIDTRLIMIRNGEHEFDKMKDDKMTLDAFGQVMLFLKQNLEL